MIFSSLEFSIPREHAQKYSNCNLPSLSLSLLFVFFPVLQWQALAIKKKWGLKIKLVLEFLNKLWGLGTE
jgi:hypothetical protein